MSCVSCSSSQTVLLLILKKQPLYPQVPVNLKSELCSPPGILPYPEEFWAVLSTETYRICITDPCKQWQAEISESILSFITQRAWNDFFCLLDIVHWIVFFTKWQMHFISFLASHTFNFRHLNRNMRNEVQVDYYTQEPKADIGGLLGFLIWFFF